MNSGGHRGFTVVTIITLIFAPIFIHHEWAWRLVGQTKVSHVEQCAPKQPCPAQKVIVNIVRQPIPPGGGNTGGGGAGGGDTGGGDTGGGDTGGGHTGGGNDHGGKGSGDKGGGDKGGNGGNGGGDHGRKGQH